MKRDKTPTMRPRRKTPDAQLPVTECPFCRRTDVQVMPSGLLALHTIKNRYSTKMCRGGGEPIRSIKKKK